MSYLKFGLDRLSSRRIRQYAPRSAGIIAQIAFALMLALQTFSAQAEIHFNPRFLADDPSAVADLSSFEKDMSCHPARTASISG